MKLKFPYLLKPLGTIIQQNYWSFYPSEPFSFVHFNMIHPVFYRFNVKLTSIPSGIANTVIPKNVWNLEWKPVRYSITTKKEPNNEEKSHQSSQRKSNLAFFPHYSGSFIVFVFFEYPTRNNEEKSHQSSQRKSNLAFSSLCIQVLLFSSRTLVAKALKVLIMIESNLYLFFANFLHIPKSYLPDHPKQSSQIIFQKNSQFSNLLSLISNFHDNINLEKKMP